MQKASERLEPIVDGAVKTLQRLFEGGYDEDELAVARVASSSLATWAKLKQTERAQEAIYFSMAREMAQDREQLARYIELTMPGVPLAGVLEAKKLPSKKGAAKKLPADK